MNLQHERIALLCEALSLPCVAQGYGAAAQHAAKTDMGYSDFLEGLLKEEASGRRVRKQTMLTRLAGFPVIKTLDDFSYDFAKGSRKARSRSWPDWALWSAGKTLCWSAPAVLARRTWPLRWATGPHRPASKHAS